MERQSWSTESLVVRKNPLPSTGEMDANTQSVVAQGDQWYSEQRGGVLQRWALCGLRKDNITRMEEITQESRGGDCHIEKEEEPL